MSTVSSAEVANPRWLAPEIMNFQEFTAAADVYSYGVILWWIFREFFPIFHWIFDEFSLKSTGSFQVQSRYRTEHVVVTTIYLSLRHSIITIATNNDVITHLPRELLTRVDYFAEISFNSQIEINVKSGKRPPIPSDCPSKYSALVNRCWAQVNFLYIIFKLKPISFDRCQIWHIITSWWFFD